MGIPKNETEDEPAASAAVRASEATYGPKNTVPMVVLKAEFAQSYIAQPKISLLSLMIAVSFAMPSPCVESGLSVNTSQYKEFFRLCKVKRVKE